MGNVKMRTPTTGTRIPVALVGLGLVFRIGTFLLWPIMFLGILAIRMTRRGAPLQAVQTHGRWSSPQMTAKYTRGEKALAALKWL